MHVGADAKESLDCMRTCLSTPAAGQLGMCTCSLSATGGHCKCLMAIKAKSQQLARHGAL